MPMVTFKTVWPEMMRLDFFHLNHRRQASERPAHLFVEGVARHASIKLADESRVI